MLKRTRCYEYNATVRILCSTHQSHTHFSKHPNQRTTRFEAVAPDGCTLASTLPLQNTTLLSLCLCYTEAICPTLQGSAVVCSGLALCPPLELPCLRVNIIVCFVRFVKQNQNESPSLYSEIVPFWSLRRISCALSRSNTCACGCPYELSLPA